MAVPPETKEMLSNSRLMVIVTMWHKLTQNTTNRILLSMRATMNISLPEPLKEWVEQQVESGGYGTVSEYFRELIREKQQRQLREQIDKKLLAAIDSGDSIPVTPEFWEERRNELSRRVKKRGKQ